jgi:glycosyltransferase involved in cell wall biosynthesis
LGGRFVRAAEITDRALQPKETHSPKLGDMESSDAERAQSSEMDGGGLVSVLMCTCNRPEDATRAVRSLLDSPRTPVEVLIVDQSSDRATEAALAELIRDPRVRYVASRTKGKGAAMNEGLALARSEFVVCTDDDCEVPTNWAGDMAALLASQPRTAVLFCSVVAPPHDESIGYVPQYRPARDRLFRSAMSTCLHRGIGAGMAVRRDAVMSLDGIDQSFGPGARFASGDDWDLQLRTILTGWDSFETNTLQVVHHGFRTYEQGKAHTRRDWFAMGAAAAKPVRAGHIGLVFLGLELLLIDAVVPMLRDLMSLRKPQGIRRITAFCNGFARGLATPVDRTTLKYRAG